MNQYPTSSRGVYMDPSQDGITHINIYSQGKTELGQWCSNFAFAPFEHPQFGTFNSIEAFWYWLSTGSKYDHLRYLHGMTAKQAGKAIAKVNVLNFDQHIAYAINLRITQHPTLLVALRESTLPFAHYYKFDGRVVYPAKHEWIVGVFEDRRLAEQNR